MIFLPNKKYSNVSVTAMISLLHQVTVVQENYLVVYFTLSVVYNSHYIMLVPLYWKSSTVYSTVCLHCCHEKKKKTTYGAQCSTSASFTDCNAVTSNIVLFYVRCVHRSKVDEKRISDWHISISYEYPKMVGKEVSVRQVTRSDFTKKKDFILQSFFCHENCVLQ